MYEDDKNKFIFIFMEMEISLNSSKEVKCVIY